MTAGLNTLPPFGHRVLLWVFWANRFDWYIGWLVSCSNQLFWYTPELDEYIELDAVRHWMPLPESPSTH